MLVTEGTLMSLSVIARSEFLSFSVAATQSFVFSTGELFAFYVGIVSPSVVVCLITILEF